MATAKTQIAQALRAAADDERSRKTVEVMRDHLEEIIAAQAAGVRRAKILEILAAHGIEIPPNTFASTLRRLKEEAGLQGETKPASKRKTKKATK
jgi:hypothetical protein